MILALAGRVENVASEKPFDNRYYFTTHFKEIFDKLGVMLFPIISEKNPDRISDMCDALILPGSYTDIPPGYYGEEAVEGRSYDVDEFAFDNRLIGFFAEKNKPILGICGGMQSINVHFGGSLHQSIVGHKGAGLTHKVKLKTGSFLHKTYGVQELKVNSLHCQAVKTLAPGFDAIAKSHDGITEAIQRDNIIGVQWHPEVLRDFDFFRSFIDTYITCGNI